MSNSSTPKRQLVVDAGDGLGENDTLHLKRNKLESLATRHVAGHSLSTSNYLETPQTRSTLGFRNKSSPPIQIPDPGTGLEPPSPSISEDICFGMLKDIPIRIDRVFEKRSIKFNDMENSPFLALELLIKPSRCDILFQDVSIATMDKMTHLKLKAISHAYVLRFAGWVPRPEMQEKLTEAEAPADHKSPAITCRMNVHIFGARSIADTLAKDLSNGRLFLQHPNPQPTGFDYENPQYLNLGRLGLADGPSTTSIPVEDVRQLEAPDQQVTGDEDEVEDLRAVMDNLPYCSNLREVGIDERIVSPLKDHQREAVNFVTSRELAEDANSASLWKLKSTTDLSESPKYEHLITMSESSKPEDFLGGILADGMGLGKTLTMISSIVASLSRAEQFGMARKAENYSGNPKKRPVKATLVIVPSTLLLDGWIDEIVKHVAPRTLTFYKYHGPNRALPSSTAPPYDIIMSTYGTVESDRRRGGGVLDAFHWYRLILDEAHFIRNSSTKNFKAVANLSASIRWCLTGTPVQNSLDDLASLIRFLQVPLLEDSKTFKRHMMGKKRKAKGIEVPIPDYKNLKLLLGSICLRRSTSTILSSLGVEYIERRPDFSDTERRDYDMLATSCEQSIKEAVNGKATKKQHASILTAMLKLRILCNTGCAGLMGDTTDDVEKQLEPDEQISLLQQKGEAICTKCSSDMLSGDAGGVCDKQHGKTHRQLRCQICIQGDFTSEKAGASPAEVSSLGNIVDDPMEDVQYEIEQNHVPATDPNISEPKRYPSKLIALLENVTEHYARDKSIVFSFWRRSLDLVGKLFEEQGLNFRRVDGSVPSNLRRKILAEFYNNPEVRVLLMTIGTGAVGLNNLSIASRVHILEPQWNPSVEDQAVGRIFRMGQAKNVSVIRYVMSKTIEESIESRQISKLQLAMKGGLHNAGSKELSEGERRVAYLRELGTIIGSTIISRSDGKGK
ncbi:SNF2 family N-terminal domain-containing protein [Podospora appendiculata]|uniref:SNF2 family N-terminal domain-containing protein n=1 Tax=Podospora appendiculata TaxID=314037 RepID=A0AAE0X421_9PEZI|nr:SNF2 family N-terminal domain-containing protein [Podospora appendiculata]